ncbi:MAG TPA: cation diffusion facilitator family transporter [Mycobacteriales bacterium]|jgi:cation diffusion facilitator family transporter|nr:cation diffusion facilitator family transporter [Mycobacteriales bacterium]
MSAGGGRKAVIAALLANLGIAVSKLVAFVVTRSSSMLAEAVHSFADCGNQGLLLLGARRAEQAPDEEHPFGHGQARYFYGFVVALVLFSLGGAFALYEGYEKLRHPHEVDSPVVALVVLVVAIVLEAFSLRTAVRETRPYLEGRSYWRFVREAKTPELPVVLLEDTAALLGLVFAFAGVSLTALTHREAFDAFGTMAIGALLVVVAGVLAYEMSSLLLGEAARPEQVAAIERALVANGDFARVIHLRTLHLGPDQLLVGAKVATPRGIPSDVLSQQIDDAEERVRAAVPSAALIYLEPDVDRA